MEGTKVMCIFNKLAGLIVRFFVSVAVAVSIWHKNVSKSSKNVV